MLSITDDFRIIHHMLDCRFINGLSNFNITKTRGADWPEEFASPSLPPHVSIYTWSTCTLHELALELAAAKPSALPTPAIGTRLSFQLVCPDLRGTSVNNTGQPKFAVKELGSIVIGEGYPGTENTDEADPDVSMRDDGGKDKTLADWRFVVGDYVSCAVLPPLSDGSVAPPANTRRGSISSGREGRTSSFREASQAETATLAATMAARVGRRVGETTDSRQVTGGEESSCQMGRLGVHEAEGAGIKLREGLGFIGMIEILKDAIYPDNLAFNRGEYGPLNWSRRLLHHQYIILSSRSKNQSIRSKQLPTSNRDRRE
ncbi:hypothetical protein TrVFT333_007161 [Trichoderma virens FT-333]|nr:hypothetical protein TrVFT333_007161 [Trichoderma virens FT-333]